MAEGTSGAASRGSIVGLRHIEQWAWLALNGHAHTATGTAAAPGTATLDMDWDEATHTTAWEVRPLGLPTADPAAQREYTLRNTGRGEVLAPDGRGRWRIVNLGDGTCALAATASKPHQHRAADAAPPEDEPTVYLCADDVEGVYLDYEPHAWSIELRGLPVIDLEGLDGRDSDPAVTRRVGRDVAVLAGEVGFFSVVNHGAEDAARDMVAAAHASLVANSGIHRTTAGDAGLFMDASRGAAPGVIKTTLASTTGWVKTRVVGDETRAGPPGWWDAAAAAQLPGFFTALDELARAVLGGVCDVLGLPDAAGGGGVFSNLRMMTYPAGGGEGAVGAADDTRAVGLDEHTDKDWLTVLVQDGTQGLEVEGRNAGEWVPVPGSLDVVINVGDALQALSGGLLKSKVHRAVVPASHARISFPLFVEPTEWPEARDARGTTYVMHEL